MIKLNKIEIDNESRTQERDNLTRKAKLLRGKVLDCSPEEQLNFFKNVVKQNIELKVHKEELDHIKGGVSS